MEIIGFSLVNMLNDRDKTKIKLTSFLLMIASFCFSMTIEVLWEFFEYGADCLLDLDI